MPYYDFVCPKGHYQEERMNFSEHAKLPEENGLPYIECNVHYGDLEHPRCTEKAFQQMCARLGFGMNYGHSGRH